MADDVNVNVEGRVKKLSHKLFKRLLQKEKRKLKRQKAAEARKQAITNEEARLENDLEYRKRIEAFEADKEKREILDRENSEKLWLQREAVAQEEFRLRKLEEERRIKQKEEQEKAIKLEWERQQQKEKEEKERKEKTTKDKEEALFREIEKEATPSQDRFHNPVAPANYGTEKDVVNCSFFLKTGACRFGERCSRQHPRPPSSVTLLIPAMYTDIRHIESALDIADRDTGLEFDEQDAYRNFLEFYDDVYPEFEKSGRILQFKVCCNYELHLRGNVYVQYTSEEDCQKAFADFNGRWYAGRQLSCEFSPVTNWKSAICDIEAHGGSWEVEISKGKPLPYNAFKSLFAQNRCPRGKNCNFLHVYRNPDDWSEQRSDNLRHNRDSGRYEEREKRPDIPSDRSRYRNRDHRSRDRDSYRHDRGYNDRRRRRRSRSRSHSDDDKARKRKRRNRSRSKSHSVERDRSSRIVANGESIKNDESSKGSGNHPMKNFRAKSRSPYNSTSSDSDRRQHRRKSKKKHKRHKRRTKTNGQSVNNSDDNGT